MRILHTVEFYEPHTGGAEEVVRQLSQRLAARGHSVTVATTEDPKRVGEVINGVTVKGFAIGGNQVSGIRGRSAEVRRYQELLASGFDVVMNYAAQSWPTDLALESLYRMTARKVLVPCGYSGLHNPRYANYFKQLPAKLTQYDALVYMSSHYQDKTFGDQHGVGNKAVFIPNGASTEEFSKPNSFDFKKAYGITTPYMALCVANHYMAKGHTFVVDAFKHMHRADTTLVIIGKPDVSSGIRSLAHWVLDYARCRKSSLLNRNIRLVNTGNRSAVVAAYQQADVFLFGSRVECSPLVMYESFASHTPFITRPVGNVRDHEGVLKIAETPAEMARVANYILDDPETGKDIAQRAFALWQLGHTWERITDQYEALYKRLLDKKHA